MNKKVISYAILPVLALVLLGSGISFAAANTETKPIDALVSAIAEKFNLKPAEVQQVVEQVKSEQRAQMATKGAEKMKERLASAVSAKKLTQAQADLIAAKHQELKTSRDALHESLKSKTPTPAQSVMKAEMDSLKQWAKDNNIPEEFVLLGPRMGFDQRSEHQGSKDEILNDRIRSDKNPDSTTK